jgi:hypothetical protein
MVKVYSFKVTASKNIGGQREIERYEDGILTKIVAGKGKKDDSVKLFQNVDGTFIRQVNGKNQNRKFEIVKMFSDISWTEVTPITSSALKAVSPNSRSTVRGCRQP